MKPRERFDGWGDGVNDPVKSKGQPVEKTSREVVAEISISLHLGHQMGCVAFLARPRFRDFWEVTKVISQSYDSSSHVVACGAQT